MGLFTALAPTVVRRELGIGNLAVAAVTVFTLFAASSVAQLLLHGLRDRLAIVNRLAPAAKRAAAISSYFVGSYVAIWVPVIGVGFAAESFGLYGAALVFATAIGALALMTEAVTVTGATSARLGHGSPCSSGWLAPQTLWRSC